MAAPGAQPIVTPWRTKQELLDVRDGLYGPAYSGALPTYGPLKILQAWKLRGNLPHAVECTGLLFEARIHHQKLSTSLSVDREQPFDFPVRAAYSVALTRFVTGYADIGRHKTGAGQTMLEVARSVGLPVHFVEMRHEATHGELPNMQRLVKLADEALKWLWDTYWSQLDIQASSNHSNTVSHEVKRQRRDEERADAAKEFRDTLKHHKTYWKLSQDRRRDVEGDDEVSDMVATFEQELHQSEMQDVERLIEIADATDGAYELLAAALCAPGYMIPASTRSISSLPDQMVTAISMFDNILQGLAQERLFMKSLLRCIVRQASTHPMSPQRGVHAGLLTWTERIFRSPEWDAVLEGRKKPLVQYYCRLVLEHARGPIEPALRDPVDEVVDKRYPDLKGWWEASLTALEEPDSPI